MGTAGRVGGWAVGRMALAGVVLAAYPPIRLTAQCPDGAPPPCRIASRPAPVAIDTHVILVLPFRVSGADTSLAEGLAELLAVEFTGQGTPRAADMSTVLRSWRTAGGGARAPLELSAARRMAARLGAGRILTASVVATGRRLSIAAQVIGTSDGAVAMRAGPVQGTEDSLPDLLHAIAGQLISLPAGAGAGFTGVPTIALRAFMAARAAYRRSEWADAARLFEQALQVDSTFAFAALGRLESDGWTRLPSTDLPRIRRLAWTWRARLDPVHQALLSAIVGPRYPEPFTVLEALEARAAVTKLAPDNADGWFFFGDQLVHRGGLLGIDGLAQARVAFERALQLDSGLSEAALHLSTIGLLSGDLELTRRYGLLALRLAPAEPLLTRLELAVADGRAARVTDSLIRNISSMSESQLSMVPVFQTAIEYVDTALIEASDTELARRATTESDRLLAAWGRFRWLQNRGRPAAAESVLVAEFGPRINARFARVMGALFSGGDSAAAAAAVGDWPASDSTIASFDHCLLGMWWVRHGDDDAAGREALALRASEQGATGIPAWCAPLIDAGIATHQRRADARTLLARADSIIAQGMPTRAGWEGLALGRMWAAMGDWTAALRAVRRREWMGGGRTGHGDHEAERNRAEGLWAARAGDVAGARRAYRRYLILRAMPEPSRMPQRDSVLAEQAALGSRP